MSEVTRPALRYHGGKFRLAPWIQSFFPEHRIYTEAFGGAAGVLLQKPRSHGEVYGDIDLDVANFFTLIRDPVTREQLVEAVRFTPYHRSEFELAWAPTDDRLERARRLCVRAMMGFGSAGASGGGTGLRTDTNRRFTTAMQDWASYPTALRAAGERFAGVLIETRAAVDVLQQHDGPDTLHFVDPPYVTATRVMRKGGGYHHELTDDDHAELLAVLLELQGMVVLSGYSTELYDKTLAGWRRFETQSRASAGRGTVMRTEVVWLNPACSEALQRSRGGLFAEHAA